MHIHKALAWHTWGINYTLKRCMWAMRALVCFCIRDCVNMCCCWFIYIYIYKTSRQHTCTRLMQLAKHCDCPIARAQSFNSLTLCTRGVRGTSKFLIPIQCAPISRLHRTACYPEPIYAWSLVSVLPRARLCTQITGYLVMCVYVCVSRCSREFKCDVCAKPRVVDASRWFSSERAPPSREGFHISSAELNSIRRPFPEHK